MASKLKSSPSALRANGLSKTVASLINEIQEIYLSDQIPWVVGYSGGKDSTAALQLVWMALEQLSPGQRAKPVHVITTDTLVENPIVAAWVTKSLGTMKEVASKKGLPIHPHRLTPEISDSYWVNLIGRGYPAPRPKFRWCTERLKINPSNAFITNVVRENGEAIVVLGTRKAESAVRARTMNRLEQQRIRDRLSPNTTLPNSLVFSPIEDWSNDDVWLFLMQFPNAWGYDNKNLLTMYQGATQDGECPLVIDTTTRSCGDSRFGCWVCTLVDKDKSMTAMIQNDDEKEWMLPLLELRNSLDSRDDSGHRNDRHLRDFRRLRGNVELFKERTIPGPYTQSSREQWLRKVLETEQWVRKNGPEHVRQIELISIAELHEIRRIWVIDKHELEDSLPGIYAQVTGEEFPGRRLDDNQVFGAEEIEILRELCDGDLLHFELTRELLDVEGRYRTMARRAGLYEALERTIRRGFYDDETDATERAHRHRAVKSAVESERNGYSDGAETLNSMLADAAGLESLT